MERVPLTAHDVEMTGGHACAKPPVGSGGQPGADSCGGMSQGPILREITLPRSALGVVFEAGSTKIKELREGSPLLGHVQPGERVVAFTREDGSMIECTGMSDAALVHELKQTVHQSGRIITVEAVTPTGNPLVGPYESGEDGGRRGVGAPLFPSPLRDRRCVLAACGTSLAATTAAQVLARWDRISRRSCHR